MLEVGSHAIDASPMHTDLALALGAAFEAFWMEAERRFKWDGDPLVPDFQFAIFVHATSCHPVKHDGSSTLVKGRKSKNVP